MKKKVKNPGKKLDRLATELGKTIKGMTPQQGGVCPEVKIRNYN